MCVLVYVFVCMHLDCGRCISKHLTHQFCEAYSYRLPEMLIITMLSGINFSISNVYFWGDNGDFVYFVIRTVERSTEGDSRQVGSVESH